MDVDEQAYLVMRLNDAARAMEDARAVLMTHGIAAPGMPGLLAHIVITGAEVEGCRARAEKL